ncbi:3-oxoacyl-ACP synthase III family protein [Aquimarina megaterium]|uniref:3-oxoacyl-ACP synthase III family protein n=1 Tax=Aquimarina megaterium TaxID=1443666 RepID=UPI00046F9946|nr:ketoacyl-ACP synthase III [Aquimarina megaterium]
MGVQISEIEYYLPVNKKTNEDLQRENPEWDVDKVASKTGIYSRHIAGKDETALDLAIKALEKLFTNTSVKKEDIDGIIFCTQSPDYLMPSNSFLIHKKFEFDKNVWTFDYNLACSGYVYGLCIARGFIETNMAKNILLITSDTYSKYIHEKDRSTVNLFGDGAAVTIVSNSDSDNVGIIDAMLSSSGKEYKSFYIPSGGSRMPKNETSKEETKDSSGNIKHSENIHMNGFAVWKFISRIVPQQIEKILENNNLTIDDIDFLGFHQASKLTLESLAKALKISNNKIYTNLDKIGNTVSSSIPIALKDAMEEKKLKRGDLIVLSGFGVGLSWGTLLMKF